MSVNYAIDFGRNLLITAQKVILKIVGEVMTCISVEFA